MKLATTRATAEATEDARTLSSDNDPYPIAGCKVFPWSKDTVVEPPRCSILQSPQRLKTFKTGFCAATRTEWMAEQSASGQPATRSSVNSSGPLFTAGCSPPGVAGSGCLRSSFSVTSRKKI